MKNHIQHIVYSLTLMTLLSFSASAQSHNEHQADTLQFNSPLERFKQMGDSLEIRFTIDIHAFSLKSRHGLDFTPVLKSSKTEYTLPRILLKGRNNYKNYRRELALKKNQRRSSLDTLEHHSIIKYFGKHITDTVLQYSYILPYKPWMHDASLVLHSDLLCTCGTSCRHDEMLYHNSTLLSNLAVLEFFPFIGESIEESHEERIENNREDSLDNKLKDKLNSNPKISLSDSLHIASSKLISDSLKVIITALTSKYPFVAHLSDYEEDLKVIGTDKNNDKEGISIYFTGNSSRVNINDPRNREALRHIKNATSLLSASNGLQLAKILIVGFSSIEGSYSYNKTLSGRRAQSISDYLINITKLPPSMIDTQSGGENWGDLRELISLSDMNGKQEALAIIDKVGIFSGRETQLINLQGGAPYRYIKKHFFPELRKAGYIRIYYDIIKDTTAEQINLAILDIKAKQYDKALLKLHSVASDTRSQLAFGVCYMMMGDLVTAKIYLKKAVESGDVNAQRNLDQILRHEQIKNKE